MFVKENFRNVKPAILLVIVFLVTSCASAAQPSPTILPKPSSTPIPTKTSQPTETPMPPPTHLPEIELNPELPEGDAQEGFVVAVRYGCHGCHVNELHPEYGPRFSATNEVPGILERGETRFTDTSYSGRATTNQEYVIESVLQPEAFFAPGEWPKPMPTLIAQIITEQELADILAWVETIE